MTTPVHVWHPPPDNLTLSKNAVHIWIAALDYPAIPVQKFERILSIEERRKAERFCFNRDKKKSIVGRGVLRTIIGKYYLNIDPSRLDFCLGRRGKPSIANSLGGDAFKFNQADSSEFALYAFTNGLDVGVDIEYMRPIPDAQQIVDGSFSKQEKAGFNALSDRQKQEAFFNCWTRKEAYIKAIGEGLYFPLDQFAVSLSPGEPCRLLHVAGQPEEASRWSLKSFTPEINYKAALAVRCNDCNISYWRFPW